MQQIKKLGFILRKGQCDHLYENNNVFNLFILLTGGQLVVRVGVSSRFSIALAY